LRESLRWIAITLGRGRPPPMPSTLDGQLLLRVTVHFWVIALPPGARGGPCSIRRVTWWGADPWQLSQTF
jgi:hypothetical protein